MAIELADEKKMVLLSNIYFAGFKELKLCIHAKVDGSSLLHALVGIAVSYSATQDDAGKIMSYARYFPSCASDCLSLYPLASANANEHFRTMLIENGLFSVFIRFNLMARSDITCQDLMECGIVLSKSGKNEEKEKFFNFVRLHKGLSEFEKIRVMRVFHKKDPLLRRVL